MARLRGPDGCPWDREQDHRSLARCLVEECAELLETIDRLDMEHMKEELGDVLLQVVFHAQMAEEAGYFDFETVATEINRKLVRRHPHVFGDMNLGDSEAVLDQWEKIKDGEKKAGPDQGNGLFKELPPVLPSLLYAYNVVKQIEKKALALPPSVEVENKKIEALAEGLDEERAGALLFEVAAACRRKGIDPESALRRFAHKVMREFESEAAADR